MVRGRLVAAVLGGALLAGSAVLWAADSAIEMTPLTPARNKSIYQYLDTKLPEIKVDAVPAEKVFKYLRDATGVNLSVDWKILEAAGVTKDTPITFDVHDVSLRKVLRMTLDQMSSTVQLGFTIDEGVIGITTQDEADKHVFTRVYVVDDLLFEPVQIQMPTSNNLGNLTQSANQSASGTSGNSTSGVGSLFSSNTNGQGSQQSSTATTEKSKDDRGKELTDMIRDTVRRDNWHENGGNWTIRYYSGRIVVTAPWDVQEQIGGPFNPEGGQRLAGN